MKDLKDERQAFAHKHAFQEKQGILLDGIHYCKSQGWKPIFVIPPIPESTREYISNDFVQAFVYDNVNQILEKEEIEFLDYYTDKRITADMYKNDIFMNEKGRQCFSKILFEDIESDF